MVEDDTAVHAAAAAEVGVYMVVAVAVVADTCFHFDGLYGSSVDSSHAAAGAVAVVTARSVAGEEHSTMVHRLKEAKEQESMELHCHTDAPVESLVHCYLYLFHLLVVLMIRTGRMCVSVVRWMIRTIRHPNQIPNQMAVYRRRPAWWGTSGGGAVEQV